MELKKILQTALEFEKKGHNIYSETAKKSINPIVKRTFDYLAGQEINHINEITEFIKKEKPKIKLKGDRINETQNFFNTTVSEFKEKTKLSTDDIKAHETALELEQSAFDFYKSQIGKSKDNFADKFFTFLMEQEQAHYNLIQKSYEYIKDPENFYSDKEGWMFEG